ncbi:MAG: nucleotidyltransferase family protein [Ilumatobacter sp.]|nr:nucleotidyltransferase family protein [Ilumatobacter sp.]
MSTPTIAVLLAAGAGTRFDGDGHKLDAELDGLPIADHAVRAAVEADIGPVVVVAGANAPALASLASELAVGTVTVVDNPRWADGMSTSLAVGVSTARARGAHAVVVGLADQPFVTPETWRAVAASTWPIAAAEYDGRLRNPVRLHHSVWPLLPDAGDHGARHLLRLRPELVERVPSQGSPADIDTLEDLRSWQNRSSTNSR